MNNCKYCNSITKGKICNSNICKNTYKREYNKKHRITNPEYYSLKKKKDKENRYKRKDKELKYRQSRYYSSDLKNIISITYSNVKGRAKQYSLQFDLDKEFLLDLIKVQEQKCALTGLDFKYDPENVEVAHKRPFAPSLDRIDSTKGYTKDNVRFVCIIVNFALSEFGDKAFDKMCRAYMMNNLLESACK